MWNSFLAVLVTLAVSDALRIGDVTSLKQACENGFSDVDKISTMRKFIDQIGELPSIQIPRECQDFKRGLLELGKIMTVGARDVCHSEHINMMINYDQEHKNNAFFARYSTQVSKVCRQNIIDNLMQAEREDPFFLVLVSAEELARNVDSEFKSISLIKSVEQLELNIDTTNRVARVIDNHLRIPIRQYCYDATPYYQGVIATNKLAKLGYNTESSIVHPNLSKWLTAIQICRILDAFDAKSPMVGVDTSYFELPKFISFEKNKLGDELDRFPNHAYPTSDRSALKKLLSIFFV